MLATTTVAAATATDMISPSLGAKAIISTDDDNRTNSAWKDVDEKS
jgi:hypothetical protein